MGTHLPTSMNVSQREMDGQSNPAEKLDAGALFVLKSRGKENPLN